MEDPALGEAGASIGGAAEGLGEGDVGAGEEGEGGAAPQPAAVTGDAGKVAEEACSAAGTSAETEQTQVLYDHHSYTLLRVGRLGFHVEG